MKPISILVAIAVLAGSMAACSGERSASPTASPTAPASGASAGPTTQSDQSWEPDAGSDAGAKKGAAKAAPADTPRKVIQPTLTGSKAVNADVGAGGAVLVLGGTATLRVPKDALPDGAAIHFAFAEESFKGGPGRAGAVYELAPALKSAGRPFVLELPADPKVAKPNIAFSKTMKSKGNEWLDWDVLAPTRIDADKKLIIIELPELPQAWVHLTSKPAKKK